MKLRLLQMREYFEPPKKKRPLFWGLPTPNMRVWLEECRRLARDVERGSALDTARGTPGKV